MQVLVVYESLFGTTHEVAEAVAAGIAEAQPGSSVRCLRVAEADPALVAAADLLVVGGPTHMRGMTSGLSRRMGLRAERQAAAAKQADFTPAAGAAGPGVRDFLGSLPRAIEGRRAAAFDTRVDARPAGGAAHGIARRLTRRGYTLAAEPEGFVVEDTEGPLRAGERDRAAGWGAGLLRRPVR